MHEFYTKCKIRQVKLPQKFADIPAGKQVDRVADEGGADEKSLVGFGGGTGEAGEDGVAPHDTPTMGDERCWAEPEVVAHRMH
jgi:hypothetical protein